MKHMAKWAAAIGLSLLAHAGGAMLLAPEEEKELALIAGGSTVEVSLLGNAFEDTVQAGTHPKWWSRRKRRPRN